MSSNVKPKPSSKESPTEPFKRAVTGCLRAIARKGDLDVVFAAERPVRESIDRTLPAGNQLVEAVQIARRRAGYELLIRPDCRHQGA